MSVLLTPRLRLRPPVPEDAGPFLAILVEPGVAAWWPGYDEARVGQEIVGPADEGEHRFVIEADGAVVGFLQVWEELEPDYRHAGLDLFLATAVQGRGLGPEAIRAAVRWVAHRGHHRVTIDPDAENARAVAAYTAVGFRPVGVMRRYGRRGDGTWVDHLLMDMLVEELVG